MPEEPPPSYESATFDGDPCSSRKSRGRPQVNRALSDGHRPAIQATSHPPMAPRILVSPEFSTITRSCDPTQQLTCVVTVELTSRPPNILVPSPAMGPPNRPRITIPSRTRRPSLDYHEFKALEDRSDFADSILNYPSSPDSSAPSGQFAYNPTPPAQNTEFPLCPITEDLRNRIVDWKGRPLSALGPLQLFNLLGVRHGSNLEEFHVYLFKEAIVCVSEEKKLLRGLGRLLSSASGSTQQTKSALRLKGRISIRHIKQVKETSVPGEFRLTIHMDVECLDTFVLIFKDRSILETWRRRIAELVASFCETSLIFSGTDPSESAPNAHSATTAPHSPQLSLTSITEDLCNRLIDCKGHPLSALGQLQMYDILDVRRDSLLREFRVYLFEEAILCVSEKGPARSLGRLLSSTSNPAQQTQGNLRLQLRGRIHIRHIKQIIDTSASGELSLTIDMKDESLDSFLLLFTDPSTLTRWLARIADLVASFHSPLLTIKDTPESPVPLTATESNADGLNSNEHTHSPCVVSPHLSGVSGSTPPAHPHTPLDLTVVISLPPSTANHSTGALKNRIIKSALDFIIATLGPSDRLCLVTFEIGLGGLVRKTPLLYPGRPQEQSLLTKFVDSIGGQVGTAEDEFMVPTAQDEKTDVVTAVNHGLDVMVQYKAQNSISGIMVVCDLPDGIRRTRMDLLLRRTEDANVPIHSFGYGRSHDPASLWLMSNQTKGMYTFVKDWYDLRDCLAGCLGGMMSTGLLNMKIHLKIVDGRRFRIRKVSGKPSSIITSAGQDVDIDVGDLRYGERKEMLVELEMDNVNIGHGMTEGMIDEVAVFEVDGGYYDPAARKHVSRLSHPVLQTITLLPASSRPPSTNPPATSDPVIVRRRMELLAAEMVTRALVLVHQNMQEAQKVLSNTTEILRTVLQNTMQTLTPPNEHTVRNRKEALIHSTVRALEAILADIQVLAEGLHDDFEIFTHDQRHFGAQLAMILRHQTSWCGRTPTEKLFWKAENSIELVIRSAEWVGRE